ncbi:hypothetical protein RB595_001220 [Gaeumannomyces hyphopodioides]
MDSLVNPPEATSGLQRLAIAIIFVFAALALVIIVLRAVGRIRTRQFGLDDWLISIAMFLSVLETIFSYFFIKTNYVGIRPENVPAHDPMAGEVWNYLVQVFYNPILALVKSSVLIFLLRLFGQQNGARRLMHWLNAVNLLHMAATLGAITFQCTPVSLAWDPGSRGGRCVDRAVLFTATAAFNIATDLAVLGLPLWILSGLRIPRRTKLALLGVFLLGFLVTITSVARLVILVRGLFGLSAAGRTGDIGFVTSAIETNLALVTASAPALRPLLRGRGRGRGGWLPMGGRAADVEMGQPATATQGGRAGRGVRRPVVVVVREPRESREDEKEQQTMTGNSNSNSNSNSNGNGGDSTMRVSDVQREIDRLVKEMELARAALGSSGGTGKGTGGPGVGGVVGEQRRQQQTKRQQPGRNYAEERMSRYGDRRFGLVHASPAMPGPDKASGPRFF